MSHSPNLPDYSVLFDIRSETLAATLLTMDDDHDTVSGEELYIAPLGPDKRRSGNDVARLRRKYYDAEEVVQIEVNRNGLYDTLPQRLFHRLDDSHDTPKKRSRALKQQTADARRFFLPFEQAAYTARIAIEGMEQRYTDRFPDFIEAIWGLDGFSDFLSEKQRHLFCHLIPEAYRVVGDWELTGLIFSSALAKPVDLHFGPPVMLESGRASTPTENLNLGENAFLGDSFRDEFPMLEIKIHGITAGELDDYLPDGAQRIIIEQILCSYFIPLDVPYRIALEVTADSLDFILGPSVLGYNAMMSGMSDRESAGGSMTTTTETVH